MGDSSPPPKRGWKDGGSPKPGGGKPHGWKKDADAAAARPKLSKRTKRLLAAGAVGAVLALIVIVILLMRPVRPAGLVLFFATHDTDLGQQENVCGKRDLDDLVKSTGNADAGTSLVSRWWPGAMKLEHGPEKLTPDAWDRVKWDDLGEKTVIVYLAATGGADKDGPFLFWESDDNAKGDKRLRLEKVLDRLNDAKLEGRNKLLILDPGPGTANWSEGMLHDDFVRKLKEDAFQKRIEEVPHLAVLCACDVNQRSWVAEEWGQSAFGHFVIEGLKGAADANKVGKVTAAELHEYVRKNVNEWARANRDAAQEPILIGDAGVGGADLVEVNPSEARPAPSFPDPDYAALRGAWATCADLRAQVPPPAVYTPHLWRRYQDTLLRYEQLLRVGDPTGAAGELQKRLNNLQASIAEARRAPVRAALPNALPMPALLGVDGSWREGKDGARPDDALPPLVRKVTDAPTPEARKEAWAEAQHWAEGVGGPADAELTRAVLRLKATDLLLRRLADGPLSRAELDRARELLRVMEGGNPDRRPAAAQLLVMLARHGDLIEPKPDGAAEQARAVGKALSVALLAERAALATEPVDSRGNPVEPSFHPYGEAVFLWIKGRVEKADGLRFAGENLLFFERPEDWKKAAGLLKEAEDEYKEAARDAAAVREALRTRDEILAELPYYAHWLARRRLTPDPRLHAHEAEELGKSLTVAEECWRATHDLAARLDAVPPRGTARGEGGEGLEQATAKARAPFEEIRKTYNDRCNSLKKVVQVQDRWQQIEDVLSVPLVPSVEDRVALLTQAREIGKKLAGGSTQAGAVSAEAAEDEAREEAQRQGRMAVAALGERGLGDPAAVERLRRLVTAPERDHWPAALSGAGAEVGAAWNKMADRAGKLAGESGRAEDFEAAGRAAVEAAGLCRLLDGAAAGSVPAAPYSPVVGERRWRLHELLLWQAGRTSADHWYAEGEKADPYYLLSGQAYAGDAATLAEAGDDPSLNGKRQARAREMKEERLKRTGLKVADLPPLRITSEPELTLRWDVTADAGLPTGDAAVWPEAGGPVALAEAATRRKVNPWPAKVEFGVRGSAKEQPDANDEPTIKRGTVTLHGLYRGQRIAPQAEATVQRAPDNVVYHYPEKGAGLAFRADRSANKARIAIVLDASGSMGENNKYPDALEALKKVLSEVPEDTTVSIWRFGTDYDEKKQETPIDPILKPTKWDPTATDKTNRIIDRLKDKAPKGASPIAKAMIQALEKDLQGPGLKTLLVLTDGDDNEHKPLRDLSDFHEFLREQFRAHGANVFLNMILFGKPDPNKKDETDERDRALAQFGIIKKEEWKPKAQLFEAEDKEKLSKVLERALIPRVQLLRNSKPEPEAEGGLPIVFGDRPRKENLRWSKQLESGLYEGLVYNTFAQKLRLRDGDRMVVTLTPKASEILYQRALFADDPLNARKDRWPPKGDESDWVSMVLLNRLTPEGNLDMIVTLEDKARREPGSAGVLEQPRPGFQWVAVDARGGAPAGLRWANESGYPAPAWRLSLARWPEGKRPVLSLWWTRDPQPPVDATLKRDLLADPPQDELKDLPLRRQVRGQEVTVESISTETRTVRVPGGAAGERTTPCLVVRLSYPKDEPVWVRLEGHEGGEEHRYYSQSNKYAAIFWDVTEEQAKKLTLDLTSVKAFKTAAEKAGWSAPFRDLDPPGNEIVPPKPVLGAASRPSGGD